VCVREWCRCLDCRENGWLRQRLYWFELCEGQWWNKVTMRCEIAERGKKIKGSEFVARSLALSVYTIEFHHMQLFKMIVYINV